MGEAVRLYRLAAEHGYSKAQEILGEIYESGRAVEADISESAKWYRRAFEQGDTTSAARLANLLFLGKSIARDVPEAVKLWTFAADHGNPSAQCNLASSICPAWAFPATFPKRAGCSTLRAQRWMSANNWRRWRLEAPGNKWTRRDRNLPRVKKRLITHRV